MAYDYSIQGWTVSGGVAYHSECNAGYINRVFDLSSDTEWTFRYKILSLESGTVNIVVDGVSGTVRNSPGIYEETFTTSNNNATVSFYATGEASLEYVQVFSPNQEVKGTTMSFNEDVNEWISDLPFVPEFMNKFVDRFFVFKDGEIWENNINEVRNNFFGEQYPSIVQFYVNLEPTVVKNFYTIRLKSNKVWAATRIYIPPRDGKSQGQLSRLKKGRFKSYQGDFFAEFMRDLNDPRFINELDALTKGALLQGNWMEITLENNDTTEVRMMSVDVQVSPSQYTY